jgi:hypothetical protein
MSYFTLHHTQNNHYITRIGYKGSCYTHICGEWLTNLCSKSYCHTGTLVNQSAEAFVDGSRRRQEDVGAKSKARPVMELGAVSSVSWVVFFRRGWGCCGLSFLTVELLRFVSVIVVCGSGVTIQCLGKHFCCTYFNWHLLSLTFPLGFIRLRKNVDHDIIKPIPVSFPIVSPTTPGRSMPIATDANQFANAAGLLYALAF